MQGGLARSSSPRLSEINLRGALGLAGRFIGEYLDPSDLTELPALVL